MHFKQGVRLPNTIKIKTVNYLCIYFSTLISCVLIPSTFENLSAITTISILIIIFLTTNYLNRGRLLLEFNGELLIFTWEKRPLLNRFKILQIRMEDLLYASYIESLKMPDRIKIITKNKYLSFEISIQNKNDLRSILIQPLKKHIDSTPVDYLKKEKLNSSYYRKMNSIRIIAFYMFIGFLFFFLCSATWNYISHYKTIQGIVLFAFGGSLISFTIYYLSRLYISKFFNEEEYNWIKI